jgi:hypothetical protein
MIERKKGKKEIISRGNVDDGSDDGSDDSDGLGFDEDDEDADQLLEQACDMWKGADPMIKACLVLLVGGLLYQQSLVLRMILN